MRFHAVLGGDRDEPAYLLDLMDAGSLDAVLRHRGRGLPEPALAEVAALCVAGLAHLHSRTCRAWALRSARWPAPQDGAVTVAALFEKMRRKSKRRETTRGGRRRPVPNQINPITQTQRTHHRGQAPPA